MSIFKKLTEGIEQRDLKKEGSALLAKWEKTGLLEGLADGRRKSTMAVLLENQAKELLRESSAMAQGDVEGFAAVAFPIVRRVFGGLIANELVSVQPMSLPTGLIFFMDFQFTNTRLGRGANSEDGLFDSVYGGGVVGNQVTGGVSLTGSSAESSFYNLNNGYSSPTGSVTITAAQLVIAASGTAGSNPSDWVGGTATGYGTTYGSLGDRLVRYDPDVSGSTVVVASVAKSVFGGQLNVKDLVGIAMANVGGATTSQTASYGSLQINHARRLTVEDPNNSSRYLLVFHTPTVTPAAGRDSVAPVLEDILQEGLMTASYPITDNFVAGGAAGSLVGQQLWDFEDNINIPEIDMKVDSISVTAVTKKLKTKWTPELSQDLSAFHNVDAEVELTSMLSEQIALEIDREILEDLVKGATAGTYYWSRSPGLFVNRTTGLEVGATTAAPEFTGNVSMWYETLIETINDVSAQIHRKTLRGGATFIVCGPETANILEFTSGFRASVTHTDEKGEIGAVKVGSISKKWDVYVDPYFPRNLVLVGRKGSSFLESGFCFSPYVPLQVTPTILDPESFAPRKAVMTRYAKKMIRPDFYGLVVIRGMLGESGA